MTVHAHITLKEGKHTHLPNTIIVPSGRKTFPVTVQWNTEANATYIVAASHREGRKSWCVLDDDLRQVMASGGSKKPAEKGVHPHVSRGLHGGGAHNPKDMTVELVSAKLKNGHTYTLVCKLYGVIASTEFVAVAAPAAPKQAKKKAAKRKTAKKKSAKKKTAKKKTAKKKSAKKKTTKRKPAKKKAAKKKSARKKK